MKNPGFSQVPIKKVQEFWDKRPCNLRHSPLKVGTKKYFDEVEKRKYFVEPHIIPFAQFPRWKDKKVLEIGCGIGTDTINFARHGAKVTAVDLSPKSLKIAQKRAKIFKLEKAVTFYQANAEKLSQRLPVKSYDLIYSFGVIHHTPHPEKVIQEIKKYCHQETVVKIMVYHKYSFKALWILFKFGQGRFDKLKQLITKYSEAQTDSPVTYTYSKTEAQKLLKDFQISQMLVDHIFPYIISEYKQHRYKKIWYFRHMPDFLFHFLERTFGWHLCLTAKPK